MALYVLVNFESYHREVAFPPRPLPSDYEEPCPGFVLVEVEECARDYKVPQLPLVVFLAMLLNDAVKLSILYRKRPVQATFYAMLLNDAVELGIVGGFMATDLKATLEGLWWTSSESCLNINRRGLLEAQLHQRTPLWGARGPVNGWEESLSSNDPPPPFSDEE
ncbi:hypothetical protein Cgig2_022425 [Carnegiea gigantea]|uniref:Uncharacterized protein n=1 Tax=Carnegiea gigantea TaxID=171969 RepID=A0A9Q1JFA0_9CARY|nr:hypothetical protein Cgig2_022425 [Carnegiea gigantea]